MPILATYNIKGGVGKTASAVNLAWESANQWKYTVLWDLDPQGAATFYFRIREKVKGGSFSILSGKRLLGSVMKGTNFQHLDLIPADIRYRHMDLQISDHKKGTKILKFIK